MPLSSQRFCINSLKPCGIWLAVRTASASICNTKWNVCFKRVLKLQHDNGKCIFTKYNYIIFLCYLLAFNKLRYWMCPPSSLPH
jgi:hypothetical protein